MLSVIDIIEDATVGGPGFRTTIYTTGCSNKCPGCHDPEPWDIHKGKKVRTEEIVEETLVDESANITFSGGDPMFQPEGFTGAAKAIREESQKTVWCCTGYKFKGLIENPAQVALLSYIDALVDGRYKQTPQDESLLLRESDNQQLADIQASLNRREVVTYKYNPLI